jgi:hypothetical protein
MLFNIIILQILLIGFRPPRERPKIILNTVSAPIYYLLVVVDCNLVSNRYLENSLKTNHKSTLMAGAKAFHLNQGSTHQIKLTQSINSAPVSVENSVRLFIC